jgi:PAS domain S-box-containing protein
LRARCHSLIADLGSMLIEKIWDRRNRFPIFAASVGMVTLIALADWRTEAYIALGFLYLFPIMLAAGFLPRPAIVGSGILCAGLNEMFASLEPAGRVSRLTLTTLAFAGCGLFCSELIRNRRLALETQHRLRALVETSPAAIVLVDHGGVIELVNRAAEELLVPNDGLLAGYPIARFLPELQNVLTDNSQTDLRASMQSQVHRIAGEPFAAEVWFSTYIENGLPKLAAIIADVSEEQAAGALSAPPADASTGDQQFNVRQKAVIRLVLKGLTNVQIAARLEMSTSSVNNVLRQLFAKTGAHSRSQLVRAALERYKDLL